MYTHLNRALVFLLMFSGPLSCRALHPSPSPPNIAWAQTNPSPQTRSAQQFALRLTPSRILVLSLQNQYIATEGPLGRGPKFADLVSAIDGVTQNGCDMSETELFELLGLPEYGLSTDKGAEYMFLYNGPIHDADYVEVSVNQAGLVDGFRYNKTTAASLSGVPRYHFPPTHSSDGVQLNGSANYFGFVMSATQNHGIVVRQVIPDSPAGVAGIRPGDFIVAVNGESVLEYEPDRLIRLLSQFRPGVVVTLRIERRGGPTAPQTIIANVKVAPAPTTRIVIPKVDNN